jgi:pimeloyl-ACP methyl ester carboxylesterase
VDAHLDRPGARIAYSSAGPADAEHTVVVTHSLATGREWEDAAGIFDWSDIARAGERLVRFDTRGHGASTGDTDETHYRWTRLAEDLVAVADATSPGRQVDALGESTGCGTVLWAAIAAPDRFRRLVLVVPPTRTAARAEQAELYRAAATLTELRGPEAWQRLVSASAPAPVLRDGGWTRPGWIAVHEDLVPAVLRGAAESRFPDDEALASISLPTLILTWDTDPSHPLETAEHLAELLPSSTLEVATSPDAIRGWGARAASFLTRP